MLALFWFKILFEKRNGNENKGYLYGFLMDLMKEILKKTEKKRILLEKAIA